MPPLPLAAANATISPKAGDIVNSALREIGVLGAGAVANPTDQQDGLEALQRRIDVINAQRYLIWAVTFPVFNMIPNTQPITIGPGGQFNLAVPPVRIDSWAWIFPGGVEIIGNILTEAEWAQLPIKNLTSTLATALYYERDSGGNPTLGSLYFWPIPSQAPQVRLGIWNGIQQALNQNTLLHLPPGYWQYLVCSLAADMANSFGQSQMERVQTPAFAAKYREAKLAITQNTNSAQRISNDAPRSSRGSVVPDFNYLTGIRR